jgi:hypothetical protein
MARTVKADAGSRTLYDSQFEIDHDRGVLYVHCKETGRTLLRICNLPKPVPELGKLGTIDLTHMKGVMYAVPTVEVDR